MFYLMNSGCALDSVQTSDVRKPTLLSLLQAYALAVLSKSWALLSVSSNAKP
nr:MAG TPA: hypothetical protein [Inoviridae sp.]